MLPQADAVEHAISAFNDPALTFALAMGAGVVAHTIAHHLRLPGIVLYLATGVFLGPDVLNVVRPATLGHGLEALVGLAVAVILFEGGLNLNVRRLQRQATTIRRLVTVGAVVTAAGGALAARVFMGWEWRIAVVFGTLVIVTGPTVIAPLVRRIRIIPRLQTILEAEGVLIDPIGAIIAVVALEVVLARSAESAALGLLGMPTRFVVGAAVGTAAGFLLGWLLRRERVVPDEFQNVFTLAVLLAFFAISEAIVPESGILTAAVAGLVVGNTDTRLHTELAEFKEQLTTLFVALLFVLLAADVRLADVRALGTGGIWTIAALMFVVRPVNVALNTRGTGLSWKERGFIAWIGPRGIVAAAVASLFAQGMTDQGIAGGAELRALVFLVISVTVVVQGLSGGALATAFKLRRKTDQGYVIVGANTVGRALGRALRDADHQVVFLDSNAQEAAAATEQGFVVVFGNANDERLLTRADVEGRRGVLTVTGNEGANLLIANRVRELTTRPGTAVTVARGKASVKPDRVRRRGHRVLFGRPIEFELWHHALLRKEAAVARWRYEPTDGDPAPEDLVRGKDRADAQLLPLVVTRKRRTTPMDDRTDLAAGDVVAFAYLIDQANAVRERLTAASWVRVENES